MFVGERRDNGQIIARSWCPLCEAELARLPS
jgi:hypothetical protein